MNARKKIYLLLSLILICSMMLISCKSPTGNIIVPEEDDGVVNIGLSIDSFVIERWQRERDLFVSKAEELGAVVNVQNANGDIETQIKQIEYFIEKKVDVIVIISIDDNELVDVVSRAKKEGIRVIAYDRIIRNANVDLYISVDNIQVGKLMGMYIKDAIGNDGSIIQIKGSPTDYNVDMVQEGFESIINTTNITIDYAEFSDGWMAENGFDTTSEYLSTGKVPDAIMCGNDSIASFAIKALMENRLGGQVYVVGQDADLEACQRIVEGTQGMTVYKPVEKLALEAAEQAVRLGKGEPLGLQETYNDGTYDVPYLRLEPVAVTKENMDEIITGKYHQKSEIYLNVGEN